MSDICLKNSLKLTFKINNSACKILSLNEKINGVIKFLSKMTNFYSPVEIFIHVVQFFVRN